MAASPKKRQLAALAFAVFLVPLWWVKTLGPPKPTSSASVRVTNVTTVDVQEDYGDVDPTAAPVTPTDSPFARASTPEAPTELPVAYTSGATMGEAPITMAHVSPTNAPIAPTVSVTPKKTALYSFMRGDRSGNVVHDMIFAAAYAFKLRSDGYHYVGACIQYYGNKRLQRKERIHKKLVRTLGLKHVLQFDCPPGYYDTLVNNITTENLDPSLYEYYLEDGNESYAILNENVYREEELLTPEFRQYLISRRRGSYNSGKIAVHIRRGDVSPCSYHVREEVANPCSVDYRYSPNQLYLDILDGVMGSGDGSKVPRYRPEQVMYFSQRKSFENFTEFHKRGYTAKIDGDIGETWVEMANADVFVMSKSSFSFVPAFLNNNTVIYTPFTLLTPVEGFTVVDKDLLEKADNLRDQLCKTCNEVEAYRSKYSCDIQFDATNRTNHLYKRI